MKPSRIQSIDALRGLVMIVMALDHIRDFFHFDTSLHDPLDLNSTSLVLFLTRWITHFCAPTFIFLTGLSAYLYGQKHTRKELSRFLLTRGLWMIFLEVSVVAFGWFFSFRIHNLGHWLQHGFSECHGEVPVYHRHSRWTAYRLAS